MLRRNVRQNKGMINEELLQRLDKMEDEESHDPYRSMARKTVLQEDLFSEDDYDSVEDDFYSFSGKEEKEKISEGLGITLIIGIILIITAIIIYVFTQIML